jgi:hypothetical protein
VPALTVGVVALGGDALELERLRVLVRDGGRALIEASGAVAEQLRAERGGRCRGEQ